MNQALSPSKPATLLSLDAINQQQLHHEVGGKAAGLAKLTDMGLNVPPAFVIRDAHGSEFPAALDQAYAELGADTVAVRSSALGEDGSDTSFAGQYDTVLNVRGGDELRRAISQCVDSLNNARAAAYKASQDSGIEVGMSVVVQAMITPRAAGVLFSADPVSGRHARLVIDAVAGLGEALVSGEATPDHFELNLGGHITLRDITGEAPILSDLELLSLSGDARRAVKSAGEPLDMEWAIDADGRIHWLQARPITTLGLDLNDSFTPVKPTDVITRCNVGEMMPGPVCPLTFDVQGRAIEHGMQYMHLSYASRPAITQEWTQINRYYGHMFINMSGGLEAGRAVSLNTPESMAMSLCGRLIPELKDVENKQWLPKRWWGSLKFLRFCLQSTKYTAEFESRFRHFHIRYFDDSLQMVEEMERRFPVLCETNEVHLRSSAYSGVMEGVIQGIVSGKERDAHPERQAELQAEAARLLAGASHVESALMVEHLDEVVELIAANTGSGETFCAIDTDAAWQWLNSDQAGAAGLRFADFLRQHGHRGYRELCVRAAAWADDPTPLIQSMQASVRTRLKGLFSPKPQTKIDWPSLTPALRFLLPRAHLAVRQREQTKSDLVLATYKLKCGYRHLGRLLEAEGKLADADLVFFLSRDELSAFCRNPDAATAELCEMRRRTLGFQEQLEFEDIHIGGAAPSERQIVQSGKEGEYIGRPVSRGLVEGPARVACTLEEAAELQAGEILVSHITDIGWTPYFSMIAGLATDVGSAVSHGAVIAREYGLPAIVNLGCATKVVKTGDIVRLDADRGVLSIIKE